MQREEINERIKKLEGWGTDGKKLWKSFEFPDFKTALEFVNKIGQIAEKQNHHPDILLSYGNVEVSTTTHSAGGLTDKDFLLAEGIDRVFSTG